MSLYIVSLNMFSQPSDVSSRRRYHARSLQPSTRSLLDRPVRSRALAMIGDCTTTRVEATTALSTLGQRFRPLSPLVGLMRAISLAPGVLKTIELTLTAIRQPLECLLHRSRHWHRARRPQPASPFLRLPPRPSQEARRRSSKSYGWPWRHKVSHQAS